MPELALDQPTIVHFVLVTIALGGGAGWLSGRAIALTWRPAWMIVPAALALGLGIRFIHFALFDTVLLSLPLFGLDAIVACVFAFAGYRLTRARQMARQYGFLQRN